MAAAVAIPRLDFKGGCASDGGGENVRDGSADAARLGASLRCRGLGGAAQSCSVRRQAAKLTTAQKAELARLVEAGPDRAMAWCAGGASICATN